MNHRNKQPRVQKPHVVFRFDKWCQYDSRRDAIFWPFPSFVAPTVRELSKAVALHRVSIGYKSL